MSVWTNRQAWLVYAVSAGALFWWTGGSENFRRAEAVAVATGARDPDRVRTCEQTVLNRLASPSGYRRIRVVNAVEQMTREEVRARSDGNGFGSALYRYDAGDQRPQVWRVLIEFDAPNGFGTQIRMLGLCEAFFSADRQIEVTIGPRPAT